MKRLVTLLIAVGLLVSSVPVMAGSGCLSDPQTRRNYYNSRRQADNFTNYNNQRRMYRNRNNKPEWVQRQERQTYDLHRQKRNHSDFTEQYWETLID